MTALVFVDRSAPVFSLQLSLMPALGRRSELQLCRLIHHTQYQLPVPVSVRGQARTLAAGQRWAGLSAAAPAAGEATNRSDMAVHLVPRPHLIHQEAD